MRRRSPRELPRRGELKSDLDHDERTIRQREVRERWPQEGTDQMEGIEKMEEIEWARFWEAHARKNVVETDEDRGPMGNYGTLV